MRVYYLHGSRLKLVDTKEGVQPAIKKKASGSGNVKYDIFILLDVQLDTVNRELERCDLLTRHIIYKYTILTEEQIKAHHDLFIRRYNIDVDPVVNCKKLREAKA